MKRVALILFFAVVSYSLAGPVDHIKNLIRARRALKGAAAASGWTNPNERTYAWSMQTTNTTAYIDLMGNLDLTQEVNAAASPFPQSIAGTNSNGRVSYYADMGSPRSFYVSGAMATLTNPYTMTFWYRASVNPSGYNYLFDCQSGRIVIGTLDNNTSLNCWDGAAERLGIAQASLNDSSWHHIGIVFQTTNILWYLDGIETKNTAYSGADLGGKCRIGRENVGTAGYYYNCDLAKFNIYHSALSSNDVMTEKTETQYPNGDTETGF